MEEPGVAAERVPPYRPSTSFNCCHPWSNWGSNWTWSEPLNKSLHIKSILDSAVSSQARMGLSLVRLHSHDCFVNASHRLIFHSSLIFFCFCCIIFLFANVCKRGNGCDCGRLGYWAVVVFLFLNFPYSLDPNRN